MKYMRLWSAGVAVRRTSHCNVVFRLRRHRHAGDKMLFTKKFCAVFGEVI